MTEESVYVVHGNRIVINCGCGRPHSIRRPREGDRSAFHCGQCGVKRMYHWPPRHYAETAAREAELGAERVLERVKEVLD